MPAIPVRLGVLDLWSEAGRPSNEDAAGATAGAVWVIDGTKGPFGAQLTPGPTDATWLAQALDRILAAAYADVPADPALSLSQAAEQLCAEYARTAPLAPAHEQPSACLALAAADRSGALHLFNIGDCRILIERAGAVRLFGSSAIEPLETDAIAQLTRWRETLGEAAARQRLRGLFRRNFERAMNQPGGYWVAHPNLPWLHAVQRMSVSARDVNHLLLASDGFYRLVDLFQAYDPAGLVAAARRGGLAALGAELRSREAEDADCRRYPRLKAMDDATAVLARIVSVA